MESEGGTMSKRARLVSAAISIFIFLLAAVALAEDFSADIISVTKGGNFQGKIFISKDRIRMENPETITITRMDKKTVWILMPKDKMYMEQPFDPASVIGASDKVSGEIERKLIGQEIIGGRMSSKYQVVYNQNGRKMSMFQWLVPGLSMPVKTAAADNSWVMEYKNIKTGRQPDSLFEIPAGYQKFAYEMPSMKGILEGLNK